MQKGILLVAIMVIVGAGAFFMMKKPQNPAPIVPPPVAQDTVDNETSSPVAPAESDVPEPAGHETAQAGPANGLLWSKRCDKPKTEGSAPYCEVFQKLSETKTKQRFLEFALGYSAGREKPITGVMILPLGVMLQSGGTIQVDDKTLKAFAINTCLPEGCVAQMELDPAFLDEMTQGKTLHVKFADAKGKVMGVDMPLGGFATQLGTL